MQHNVLALQLLHLLTRLRRITQQRREKVLLLIVVVQRRGLVEISAYLRNRLAHGIVAAVFGQIVRQHLQLPAKTFDLAVAGVKHVDGFVPRSGFLCAEIQHICFLKIKF